MKKCHPEEGSIIWDLKDGMTWGNALEQEGTWHIPKTEGAVNQKAEGIFFFFNILSGGMSTSSYEETVNRIFRANNKRSVRHRKYFSFYELRTWQVYEMRRPAFFHNPEAIRVDQWQKYIQEWRDTL